MQMWTESTDPLKFVYEDIGIAAYLLVSTCTISIIVITITAINIKTYVEVINNLCN